MIGLVLLLAFSSIVFLISLYRARQHKLADNRPSLLFNLKVMLLSFVGVMIGVALLVVHYVG